jgi:hypothetical protein
MKNLKRFLIVAALAATFGLAGRANAQYQPTGDDGITASPRLRQQIDERKKVSSTPSATAVAVGYRIATDDGIAASPRLRQQLNERKTVVSVPSSAMASVGYRPTGDDGITASPRLRQQLNERPREIRVAPLK